MVRRRLGASMVALVLVVLVWDAGSGVAGADACAGATTVATDSASKAVSTRAVMCLVNAIRGDRGLRRLKLSRQLSWAARFHSRDMVSRKYFGHQGPAGDDLAVRLRRSGYPGRTASEALAWATDASAQLLVDALMGSPEHHSMLVNPRARAIGVGLTLGAPDDDVDGSASTLVLDFGE